MVFFKAIILFVISERSFAEIAVAKYEHQQNFNFDRFF
jgi:hypothetical protein